MGSLNRIVLLGEVESNPDVKATTAGDPVANFTLKVERPLRQDGGQSPPDIIKIVCWQTLADQSAQFTVGTTLLIEGQIHNRNYDDTNGVRHYVTEVEAKEICVVSESAQLAPTLSAPKVSEPALSEPSVSEPKLETAAAPSTAFDFSTEKPNSPLEVPPEFGEPVEEDIPF
jgi:single-strand DNA-binding protein